jgi:hypothetical protein
VTLPFVLLLLDYWPLGRIKNERSAMRRQLLRLVFEKILLMELSAVSSVVTLLVQRVAVGSGGGELPILSRISNDLIGYVSYVWQMLWPANLQISYDRLANRPLWQAILAATILVGITMAATILRKNAPYLIIGWLWYLGMLVPVTALVQGGWLAHADRYTYLPQIGLYIAGTWAVVDLTASWRRQRIVLGTAALLVIGVLSWSARIQTSYWRDTETLFNHAPRSPRLIKLGPAVYDCGDGAEGTSFCQGHHVAFDKLFHRPNGVTVQMQFGSDLTKRSEVDIVALRENLDGADFV